MQPSTPASTVRRFKMARAVTVQLVDDLDGGPATETVWFALDGAGYEIDLSAEHTAELRRAIAPFISAGRLTSQERGSDSPKLRTRRRPAAPARDADDADLLAEMRAWGQANGFPVSDRGRISREVREAFLATPPEVRAEQAVTFAELAKSSRPASKRRKLSPVQPAEFLAP